jgi:hypothetical protein
MRRREGAKEGERERGRVSNINFITGFVIDIANDGKEGYEKYKEQHYDFILWICKCQSWMAYKAQNTSESLRKT